VPESGISPVPEIVRLLPLIHFNQNISIKKDRNFLFLGPIPLGTTVVLEPPDTSRFARLNLGNESRWREQLEPKIY